MERDPVCGMTVDPARAKATAEHNGKTYYFCCEGCATKFLAAPEQYLAGKTPASQAPHAGIVQLGDANAGLKSIAPVSASSPAGVAPPPHTPEDIPHPPADIAAAPGPKRTGKPLKDLKRTYVCPMHPEVRESEPGPCPKCGMALEPEILAKPEIK